PSNAPVSSAICSSRKNGHPLRTPRTTKQTGSSRRSNMILKPITVVGGGLAGLTLGIGLRRLGVPVTVWEAGHYPRHRVCGEFISGNGLAVLERFGLRPLFDQAGAVPVVSARFIAGRNASPVRDLPAAALGLSRHLMDALLAEE